MSIRTPEEGRYSKVSRRMWDDEKFRRLSSPPPNAKTLWQRVLTGPELGCIPGLFAARQGGLADALEWPVEAFRECWQEIADQQMAEADWRSGVVWVPNAIAHNEPQSTNAIIGWRTAIREIPECELKRKAISALRSYLFAKGPAWSEAFDMALGEATIKPISKPSTKARSEPSSEPSAAPKSEPSCIQDQEQDKDQKTPLGPPEGEQKPDAKLVEVKKVFDFWKKEHAHPNARLDRKRIARIRARFRDGFTGRELCLAIRGAKRDEFLMGRDPRAEGKIYDGLETILRDTAQVERLIELQTGERRRGNEPTDRSQAHATVQRTLAAIGVDPRPISGGDPEEQTKDAVDIPVVVKGLAEALG